MHLSYFTPALPALLLGAAPLAAQTTSTPPVTAAAKPRQALKLGIFSSETVGGSYERQWGHYSLQTTLGYWTYHIRSGRSFELDTAATTLSYPNYLLTDLYRLRVHRLALTVQLRRYLQRAKPALVGWYVGAGAQVLGEWERYRFDDGHTERESYYAQRLQLRIGRQCQLGRRFTFDFGLGPDLALGIRRAYQLNPSTLTYARTGPRRLYAFPDASLALQVGYRL